MATQERRYGPQEVRKVLSHASRLEGDGHKDAQPGLTRRELLETAQELGFPDGHVEKALVAFDEDERIGRAQAELRQIGYRRVSGHLILFLFVNGVLALSGAFAGRPAWLLAILGLWLMGLLLHLRAVVFPDPDRLRQRARQRLAMQELAHSGRELGHSLASGAAKLMSLSAKTIDKGVAKLEPKK